MGNRILVNPMLLPGYVIVRVTDSRGRVLAYDTHPVEVFDEHTAGSYRQWLDERDPPAPQLRVIRGGLS